MDIRETASAATERLAMVERQQEVNARYIAHVRKQAEEYIALIEGENARLLMDNGSFALDALTRHEMDALTDPDVFCIIHQNMVKSAGLLGMTAPLLPAVKSLLQANVPFVHHAFIDTMYGQGNRDDTLQIILAIPSHAETEMVSKAAALLHPILEMQLLTLPRFGGYGNPSVTVQTDKKRSYGACVVWLDDGAIRIPQPMGGGEFVDLESALLEARKRAISRGLSNKSS